jgi:ubiquitin-protein ligase
MTERRLIKELNEVRILSAQDDSFRNLIVDENNLFEWKLTVLLADKEPCEIQINFPSNCLYIYYLYACEL